MNGIVMIAYGVKAQRAARRAGDALRQHCPDTPLTVVGDADPGIPGAQFVAFAAEHTGRWAKLNLDTLSTYPHTLYLDADTVVNDPAILKIFAILADGYDLTLALSPNQDAAFLTHSTAADREATLLALQNPAPLQLQAGVMGIHWTDRTHALWEAWRSEWQRAGGGQDQGALLRALDVAPVSIWLLGAPWNSRGGELIDHRFGEAR